MKTRASTEGDTAMDKKVPEKKKNNSNSPLPGAKKPLKPIMSFKSLSVKQNAAIEVLSEGYLGI